MIQEFNIRLQQHAAIIALELGVFNAMPQGCAKFQAQLDGLFSSQTNFQRPLLIAKKPFHQIILWTGISPFGILYR